MGAMENALTPYPLPPQALEPLLTLAQACDVLLIGELHGTQEVPRLVFGLLDSLAAQGYSGHGLEIPEAGRGMKGIHRRTFHASITRCASAPVDEGSA
jgi:hypothetical protein